MQGGWHLKFRSPKSYSLGMLVPNAEPRTMAKLVSKSHLGYNITLFVAYFTDLYCCTFHFVNLEIESSVILCIKLCDGMIQRHLQLWAVDRDVFGAASANRRRLYKILP